MKDLSWMASASCASADPEAFFPDRAGAGAVLQAREAQRICASCPVRGECAMYGEEIGAGYGVWGGRLRRLSDGRALPPPVRHGTAAGAKWHWRRGEQPCDGCHRADRVARMERKLRTGR